MASFAELHCHSEFSFLDGASAADELAERAQQLGLTGLAVTDHQGLYGAVRFVSALEAADVRPIVGIEIELLDPAVPDPDGFVVPSRGLRRRRGASAPPRIPGPGPGPLPIPVDGRPVRPRSERPRLPGPRPAVREDYRGVGDAQRGPHLVLLARDASGYRSLCRLVSAANLAGTKAVPRFEHGLLERHAEGLIALSGCRHGEIPRRLLAGDREGAARVAERYARLFSGSVDRAGPGTPEGAAGLTGGLAATRTVTVGLTGTPLGTRTGARAGARTSRNGIAGFFLELQHHLLPDDDWLVAELARLAAELGLPVVVTNDVHYALSEDRELQDVMVAIRHGLTLDESAHLRRPNGEYYLKGREELLALPPAERDAEPLVRRAWSEGIATAAELAERCRVDLGFERYRFPGFEVPKGETPFSHLAALCQEGARRRYHPITPPVLSQLAHELDVIERTGLAEFFLICWDLMQFARERRIPAQGRGSAGDSIVAYVLGITRVDPIRHRLLFERFINEGRTSYPDVDIDFASSRREEVIRYVYDRYGPEHTGMVCNVVTYRARSAVREVGYALGFPRPLVDRVAKALETYDSVMVRRDLEADGGFAEFFAPGEGQGTRLAESTGFVDGMGQLNHARGGRLARAEARAEAPHAAAPLPAGPEPRAEASLPDGLEPRAGVPLPAGLEPRAEAPLPDDLEPHAAASLPDGLAPRARLRAGPADDEGGPGDTPVSVRWLREQPERALGRATRTDQAPPTGHGSATAFGPVTEQAPPTGHGSATAFGPAAELAPAAGSGRHPGSTVGLSPWERWLELCARIDGRPRHLSIHVGGMLVTAAPLVDIAPLERATMPGRVVVQYDKRDVETVKLIKLDLLGLRMLSAIDDALRDVAVDCSVLVDLDRLPEDLPEVFRMIRAADTVGVFQIESRAQMQTLPRSRPRTLDDLVVEVAIIRPGPIQGNAVHPYLRRRQGIEPVTYLHPSLEPILRETLGVILYQEQVMEIAIQVAGFSAGESDGFRRAMGTWRSEREMEKLHRRFVVGCVAHSGLPEPDAEELYRRVAAFASFGFNKSHAAAFARTAYESAFLKLYYPAQFVTGLINNQPMGFYPVEVLINDAKRHGVSILPVDLNRSRYRTTTEWVGMAGEPLPEGIGIDRRPPIVRSAGCVVPDPATRGRWAAESAAGYGIRLGLHLVNGIGQEHGELLDAELERGPYRSLADVVARTDLPGEVLERLIRAGALDSLDRPRRELLWQLREVAASTGRTARGRALARSAARVHADAAMGGPVGEPAGRSGPPAGLAAAPAGRSAPPAGLAAAPAGRSAPSARRPRPATPLPGPGLADRVVSEGSARAVGASVPLDLRLPPTEAPALPLPTELERLADSYAILSLDARRQVIELFRPALERLGASTVAGLEALPPGRASMGGLVVTRQHPMTAKGTVFLAVEDETGMLNVTLWPDTWARLRSVVRRHALLFIEGDLQRDGAVLNLVARSVRSLPDLARRLGGPGRPEGVRALGYAGMRRAT